MIPVSDAGDNQLV